MVVIILVPLSFSVFNVEVLLIRGICQFKVRNLVGLLGWGTLQIVSVELNFTVRDRKLDVDVLADGVLN